MLTSLLVLPTKATKAAITAFVALLAFAIFPIQGFASQVAGSVNKLDLTTSWIGATALVVFIIAYVLVIAEEYLHLRKSKPVIIAAGIIWALVAFAYSQVGDTTSAAIAVRHNLLEYGELLLFLLAAMTYINTMEERQVFNALRAWLVSRGFTLRQVFWITGLLAFVISPVADNLTTALLMAAVVMAVGGSNVKFVSVACINIVVAANAGGAFSPFGDITTLMVWTSGTVEFQQFFVLFLPSLVNWLIPAAFMSMVVSKDTPTASTEVVTIRPGGLVIIGLFLLTISMAVTAHAVLHLPPVIGMMTGLGVLKVFGYYLKRTHSYDFRHDLEAGPEQERGALVIDNEQFNIFHQVARAEWDTLMFFYGVVLCVGGLGTIGYLALASEAMYTGLGPTQANILVGVLSAIVDNIPVMFAVLQMNPTMGLDQWLLVTLTAGVGGSLLSIGSAAGVALMGQASGVYTFFAHLKWTWAIALGYAASIWVHLLINTVKVAT